MYRYLHEDHHFSLSEYDLEHGQAENLWPLGQDSHVPK